VTWQKFVNSPFFQLILVTWKKKVDKFFPSRFSLPTHTFSNSLFLQKEGLPSKGTEKVEDMKMVEAQKRSNSCENFTFR